MRIAVVAQDGADGVSGWLQPLAEDGSPAGGPRRAEDLAAAVAALERAESPRWVWAACESDYACLARAGVRVARCHDAALTEAILLGRAGRPHEPRSLDAAWARLRGLPVPDDPPQAAGDAQPALFTIGDARSPCWSPPRARAASSPPRSPSTACPGAPTRTTRS